MSATPHTPGPWTYFVGNANGRGLIRVETSIEAPVSGHHIASMPRNDVSEANAKLIATAPDLLKALKLFVAVRNAKGGYSEQEIQHAEDMAIIMITEAEGTR